MQASPNTNINKKKKIDGYEICFKGKKKTVEKKREGMGSFALGTILSIRDKGVGVRDRTFKVSFFFFLSKRESVLKSVFLFFSKGWLVEICRICKP